MMASMKESQSEKMANLRVLGGVSGATSPSPCPCDGTPRSQSLCYRPCRHDCQLTLH